MADYLVQIEAWLDAYTRLYPFDGNILVRHKGKRLLEYSHGLAERRFGTPFGPDTRVPIASIGKAFTAGLMLRLAQEGLIDLSLPAIRYLPDSIKIDPQITPLHLLQHRSGLGDYAIGGQALETIFASLQPQERWFEQLYAPSLLQKPGEKFAYSNPGYYLLGCMIEHLTGLSLEEAYAENVWKPLGLNETGVDNPMALIPRRASGYSLKAGKIIPAPYTDARNFIPQGGLYSTIRNLESWHKALLETSFLQPAYRDLMFAAPAGVEIGPYYSCGWHVLERHGKSVQGHGGSHWGFRTHIERYPEQDSLIVVLSNLDFVHTFKIAEAISQIIWDQHPGTPQRPPRWTGQHEALEPLLGRYQQGSWKIELSHRAGTYFLSIGGESPHPVYPTSATSFHHHWLDEGYPFTQNEAGQWQVWGCVKES